VAGLLLAIAAGLGVYSRQAWEEQQVAIAATKLERDGAAAVEQTKKRPLEGLLSAMRSGESLQQLMQQKRTSEYLTGSPAYALQQALETTKYQTLLAHPAAITQMVVTPKGDRIITVGEDNVIRKWDISGNLTNCIKINDSSLRPQVSPNGDRIVLTHTSSNKADVIDSSGRPIKTLHFSERSEIVFSPTGDLIFAIESGAGSWTKDGKIPINHLSNIRIFDNSLNLISQLYPHNGNSFVIDYGNPFKSNFLASPKGNIFAANTYNSTEIRDLKGKILAQLQHEDEVSAISFNATGDKIITSSNDGFSKVWDLNGKIISILKEYKGTSQRVLNARFSPKNNQIITTKGRNIRLWGLSGKLITTFRGHQGEIRFAQFNHDGKHVISLSEDKSIKIWNLDGSVLFDFPIKFRSMQKPVLLPGGKILVEGLNDSIYIWDLPNQIAEQSIKDSRFNSYGGSLSPSLDRILIPLKNARANVLDTTGTIIAQLRLQDIPETKNHGIPYWSSWGFSRDKKNIIATTYSRKTVESQVPHDALVPIKLGMFFFDLEGKFIKVIQNQSTTDSETEAYNGVDYSLPQADSSGQYVLSSISSGGDADNPGVTFLSTKSGQKLFEVNGKRPHMNPKRNLFLTHNDDLSVKVWDFSGQLVAEFKQNQPYLTDVKFNSNGDRIIMLFQNGNIQTQAIETLPQMLQRSCTWLRTYLDVNPTELDQLPTCKAQFAKTPPKP
jgi:WD40 repeat protein